MYIEINEKWQEMQRVTLHPLMLIRYLTIISIIGNNVSKMANSVWCVSINNGNLVKPSD